MPYAYYANTIYIKNKYYNSNPRPFLWFIMHLQMYDSIHSYWWCTFTGRECENNTIYKLYQLLPI